MQFGVLIQPTNLTFEQNILLLDQETDLTQTIWEDLSYIKQETNIFKNIFEVQIRNSKQEVKWTVANITNDTMCVNMQYESPELISQEKNDTLILKPFIETDVNGTMDEILFRKSEFLKIFEFYKFTFNSSE